VSAQTRAAHQARYREWLHDHVEARFGFADEIARLADNVTRGVRNSTPPVELWGNIIVPIRVCELLREEFGPTVIGSAYRDRVYNTAVTGKPLSKSQHIENCALDPRPSRGTPADWVRFLQRIRSEGVFTGGIGLYVSSGFAHVDNRGTNADWSA
jgi:N-acetylmuramoyl-L-alanine amidase